jgi:hypothetical protein
VVVAVWSVKGGVGVTSVAALLAIAQVERAEEALLIDLCGDVAGLLGVEESQLGPGMVDWCAMTQPDPHALARVEVEARRGLRFVPRGECELIGDPAHLIDVLTKTQRNVIIDCGVISGASTFQRDVVTMVPTSLLVVRECFLNLRAAQQSTIVPTGVVVVKETRRHLGRSDVEAVTNAPVLAELAVDPSIARAIDAGLARSRLPRPLLRAMGRVLRDAA